MILLSVGASLAIAGCNGPSKAGIEARKEARERITQFSAKFVYDQAEHEFETGQLEAALGSITRAVDANPDQPKSYVLMGRIHLEMHKLDRSLEALQKATELDPEYAEAHYYAGIVYQRLTEDENALDAYNTAWELENDNPQYLLATAETHVALQDYAAARDMVESNLARFEYNGALHHLLAQITLYEGNPIGAAQIYEEASMLDPENMSLIEELAWVQYEAGWHSKCLGSTSARTSCTSRRVA
jgi:cytochrome c-type biogenesis protein CcmH/NrfG